MILNLMQFCDLRKKKKEEEVEVNKDNKNAALKFILKYEQIIGRCDSNNILLWMPGRV